jgi:hypothetical protein
MPISDADIEAAVVEPRLARPVALRLRSRGNPTKGLTPEWTPVYFAKLSPDS